MKKDILTVIVLFFIIIFLALWFSSTPSYIPYSSSIFSNQAKFEPFSTRRNIEYSTTGDNGPIDGPVSNYSITSSKDKLDIYSDAPGNLSTDGYGYFNSMGPLVMDDNMKKMLYTRGLNSTGCSSQIGGSSV